MSTSQLDIERSLVACLFKLPKMLDEISLSADAITDGPSYLIYRAMLGLNAAGRPITLVNVAEILERDDVPTPKATIVQLIDEYGIPSREVIIDQAKRLNSRYRLERLKQLAGSLAKMADRPEIEPEQILTHIEDEIASLWMTTASDTESVKGLSEAYATEILSELPTTIRVIETRIADLNAKIDGFAPGEYIVVAAPPSFGKTAFAFDVCLFNSTLGISSLYVALDQSKRSMIQRLFTAHTGMDKRQLRRRHFSDNGRDSIRQARCAISSTRGTIYINDNASLTMTDIRSLGLTFKRKRDIGILVLDYIQQIKSLGRPENRTAEMTQISSRIKALAKELDIPVIAVSQLSRAYDQGDLNPDKNQWPRPRLSMLRDSGAIEQDASTVLFLFNKLRVIQSRLGDTDKTYLSWRCKNVQGVSDAEIIVAKQKEGEVGIVSCKFNETQMRFYSLAAYPAQEDSWGSNQTAASDRPRMAPEGAAL